MKRFNKIFVLLLILILSFVMAVGSAACDLSKLKLHGGANGDSYSQNDGESSDGEKEDEKDGEEDGEEDDERDDDKDGEEDAKQEETDEESNPSGNQTEEEEPSVFPDYISFYKYIDAFDGAQSTLKLDVTSREMLAAYIEYVLFYGITEKVKLTIKYPATSFKDEYDAADELHDASVHLGMAYAAGIEYSGVTGSYFVTETAADALATKTLDQEKVYVAEQVDYAFKMVAPNVRAEDYDDFTLNSATKTLKNITNSEQLRWAIQNGYKPVCVAGSSAESVLNSAKAVLREIISDDMDDVTKLRAIYEWLALNVSYDNYAAANSSVIKASEYDSWYAEGVFNNRKAVCEGYAKAFIIMAGLEGIPAVMVTGNGHAWNRVLIDGKWYVVDATHGDAHVNDQEVFTYSQFMITDAEKTNRGYDTEDYPDLAATTDFNVYETMGFVYLEKECDLVVDNEIELNELLTVANKDKNHETDCTVTFFVKAENAGLVSEWLSSPFVGALCKSSLEPTVDLNGNVYYVLFLR